MNTHELPMILFTVIAQMCIGAFIVLGFIQIFGRAKYGEKVLNHVTDPALYAIGPALVLGLIISMFHMNDVFHTLNVIRHWQSSWLSREIIFGVTFAGFGFLFALFQWFKIGSAALRQVLAAITAVFGICLLWAMSSIYATLRSVPAWHSWFVPYQFTATALLLGSLLVCTALVITNAVYDKHPSLEVSKKFRSKKMAKVGGGADAGSVAGGGDVDHGLRAKEWAFTVSSVRALSFVAAVVGALIIVAYPIYLAQLSTGNETAQAALQMYSGAFFIVRLVLLALASIVMAFITFTVAAAAKKRTAVVLAWWVSIAFVLAIAAELMGRSLHYDVLLRVGI